MALRSLKSCMPETMTMTCQCAIIALHKLPVTNEHNSVVHLVYGSTQSNRFDRFQRMVCVVR